MYVPLLSKRAPSRAGGGGRGRGSSKGKGKGSKGGSAPPITIPGTSFSAPVKGHGGGYPIIIAPGHPFAGRTSGGSNRTEVYGTRRYGSGYPGITTPGVDNRGFPFGFWPLVLIAASLAVIPAALEAYAISEYGLPGNPDRPGGPLTISYFTSAGYPNRKFYLVADHATVAALVPEIKNDCAALLPPGEKSTDLVAFTGDDASHPLPEQAVQFYRSSSAVLTLEGYNNTAVYSSQDDAPVTPLPDNIDTALLECLNNTIGTAIPIASLTSSSMHRVSG
ncbi:hypothetical protein H0H81_004421, partial [Sphagnurus paluster]